MDTLIQKLTDRYVLHTHPDVATTVEQSLIQLSSGIYTEDERFIFELLQNAVDAFNTQNEILDVKVVIEGQYIVFMHNGDAFSERDIEGLCDIGNGNKSDDAKKIGYKGIGFKSVFMRSTCVTVKTGDSCFKFDKSYWDGYWDKHWNPAFGTKDEMKNYLMPWQIIPIKATPPTETSTARYNVITYMRVSDTSAIEQKIGELMSSSQFLLFLRAKDIKISFAVNGNMRNIITKTTTKGQVILSSNGKEDSRWLIYTNDKVKVPEELRDAINVDTNTPQKLKNAKTFDLSFAIAIGSDGKLKRLPQKDAVIYTYLPTSFKFGTDGFPFLVNANFITDAGRLQLHKDSEWNKLIFSKIPSEFLTWVKDLSTNYKNYYEILPQKSYGQSNALEKVFAAEMENAIESIAFIPQQSDASKKLLASEAIIDKIDFSKAINLQKLIAHINRTYQRKYTVNNFTFPVRYTRIFSEYGVFVIDKDKVKKLLEDVQLFEGMTADYNVKLITFLHDFCVQNQKDADELTSVLSETKFLLDENGDTQSPNTLYFYTDYKEENELASGVLLLNEAVNKAIDKLGLSKWLSKLGVQQLSNLSFIEYLYNNDDYITEENAIEIGKFVFHIYQTEDLFGEISSYKLNYVKFLSTKGSLKFAKELYLSEKYKPELNIEPILDEDIFISDKYCSTSSAAEWKVFLLKMGVREDISNNTEDVRLNGNDYDNRYDKLFFDTVKKSSERYGWIAYKGWDLSAGWGFSADNIYYGTFSFLIHCNKYKFSKLVFSKLLSKYNPEEIDTNVKYVSGYTGFIGRTIGPDMLINLGCNVDYFKWIIENCPVIPTVKHDCRKAADAYSNSIPQIEEIAGNYLPIIDIEDSISDSWQTYLGLKNHLTLNDYLFLLTEFANDTKNAENNKTKITSIYQKVIELSCLESEAQRIKIKEWATRNKILSKENVFMPPSELSHITIDGFKSKNRVYIGNCQRKDKILDLLSLMGVTIITEDRISTDYEDEKEAEELKSILIGKLSPLALIAAGEQADEVTYRTKKSSIRDLIYNTHFYQCNSIRLTYGEDDDYIVKTTFSNKNEFYYTGDLRPANIEPLLTPLCKYLDIKGKERELFILFIENFDGIRQNLDDKGYNTDLLETETYTDSGTIKTTFSYEPTLSEQERNLITGFKGEIIVFEKLKKMGYEPKCLSISSKDDYDRKIEMNGKIYYCKINYEKYDISFTTKKGTEVFVEVKATTVKKERQTNMPISYNELSMIEQCSDNNYKRYLLARVFGVEQTIQDIYIFDAYQLGDTTFMNTL